MDFKKMVLDGLREQWRRALQDKFGDTPEKLRGADMDVLAEEMFSHSMVQTSLGGFGVTKGEVAKILGEARDELLKGLDG